MQEEIVVDAGQPEAAVVPLVHQAQAVLPADVDGDAVPHGPAFEGVAQVQVAVARVAEVIEVVVVEERLVRGGDGLFQGRGFLAIAPGRLGGRSPSGRPQAERGEQDSRYEEQWLNPSSVHFSTPDMAFLHGRSVSRLGEVDTRPVRIDEFGRGGALP